MRQPKEILKILFWKSNFTTAMDIQLNKVQQNEFENALKHYGITMKFSRGMITLHSSDDKLLSPEDIQELINQ